MNEEVNPAKIKEIFNRNGCKHMISISHSNRSSLCLAFTGCGLMWFKRKYFLLVEAVSIGNAKFFRSLCLYSGKIVDSVENWPPSKVKLATIKE